jgi:sialate O-acetylesterase
MKSNNFLRGATATVILAAAMLATISPVFSQTSLPFISPLFTDHMVLQRNIPDHVWGWTTPGQTVTVQFEDKTASTVAASDGSWEATIGPFKAGGPYTLTVTGPQTATFQDVLVGDVWLCTGQSNMEFGVGFLKNSADEIANANYPNIRMYTVAKTINTVPQQSTTGNWEPVTPDNISKNEGTWNGFSAVGYFFGRDLQQDINVPIGLLQSCYGGTVAESWTSKEALRAHMTDFNDDLDALDPGVLDTRVDKWYQRADPGSQQNWQMPTTESSNWKPINAPGYFQDAGIPELSNINGIVWFRRSFDLPASDIGKSAIMHLLVDDNDTTWINGVRIGATDGFLSSRSYNVPASLLKPTGNVVVVRIYDTGGKGGFWGDPSGLSVNFDGGNIMPLAGTWDYRIGFPVPVTTPNLLPEYPGRIAGNINYPTALFNGMINPIDKFTVKGAIWYQGESNADRPVQYRTLLPTMISDWRARWNEGNFPFLIVQLAGFTTNYAELRQAQWLTAENVPNTGIVTAVDIGELYNIHPNNKQEVGRRLALVAEAKVYRQKVAYSGPVYKGNKIEGSTIRISFDHLYGGLVAKGGEPVTGFEIAGSDGNFVAANAIIDGKSVVVSAPSVTSPIAVQYDWTGFPNGNLFNSAGFPTFPFKTDEK